MVILSQDKEILVNFKNVQAINVNLRNKKEVCAWFNVSEDPKGSVLLGTYETEERAKEIIIDLRNHLMNVKNIDTTMPTNVAIAQCLLATCKIYEMPEI